MQRTVKSTKFTYAEVEIINGEIKTEIKSVKVPETDPKRAYKKAVKVLEKNFTPLNTELVEDLYMLDDEIFFKYATIVEPKKTDATNG